MELRKPPKLTGRYLSDVLASGWYTSGVVNERLKDKLSEFLGRPAKSIVLGASATACFTGLLRMLRARGLRTVTICEGTWVGMRLAVEQTGCKFATMYPDIRVLTDLGGARLGPEDEATSHAGKVIVHDCSHSCLPRPEVDFAVGSMYPGKIISGPEGGYIVCKRQEDAEELALWCYNGLRPGAAARGEPPAVPGIKANLPDTQAALACEAVDLAPAYMDQLEESWCAMSGAAYWLQLGHLVRQQNTRPYIFQITYDFSKGTPTHCPWARNFAPLPLLTLPLYPGLTKAQARQILLPFAP